MNVGDRKAATRGAPIRGAMLALSILLASSGPLLGAPRPHHWWFGGGIGLAFGDVDYVSIEPVVGYSFTPKLAVGGRLVFRYTNDSRYPEDVTTNNYGAGVFVRYLVARPLFVQAEYEYLSYEYPVSPGTTIREGFDSVLGGFGVAQPLGARTALYATALYNFSWKADEPSPYADQWIFRVGVGVLF